MVGQHRPGRRASPLRTVLTGAAIFITMLLLPPAVQSQSLRYPPTRMGDVVDDYHGTKVADPYRWLEDLNSAETASWIAAQNALTNGYLSALPRRAAIRERLTALWNYPRVTLPTRLANGLLFYRRNEGLQRQFVVWARSSPSTPGRVILDPNELSPDGSVALAQAEPSPTGRHLAYSLSQGGADWENVHVRDVRSGTDLSDTLAWVRFSTLAWTRDGRGFFYSRYPARDERERLSAALEHQAVYYHRIGTPQNDDVLIYERRDLPNWFVQAMVTDDGRYLLIYLAEGADARNRLYVADLGDPLAPSVSAPVRPVVESDDGEYSAIGNVGSTLYLRTDLDAPRRRVVALDLNRPAREHWRTIIAEGAHAIDNVRLTSKYLVVNRLVDVQSELSLYALDGSAVGRVALPGVGSIAGLSASRDAAGFYYAFTSPLYPTTVYRYDVMTKRGVPFEAPPLAFEPSQFETVRLFATSPDGTRIPLFVSSRVGVPRDGTNPTLLYGYGGFAVDEVPSFSPAVIAWMEMGGVYATASIRGGGEYGEAWHRAGMRDRKQRVFDDFIAVAGYLIAERWTSPARLAIRGGSNGGLLVGAAMTQRPDLFAVALPAVGVLDMLRYHRFTGGSAWITEYGSADDSVAFPYLYAYSPLHHVKPGTCYPSTLITTADHDDRVVPSHSFKFAATLQQAQACDNPVLIRVEQQGSHGYRPTDKLIAEMADVWAFTLGRMGR